MRALFVIAALVVAAPASADERADREEARREFAAGQAADRQRDWQTAIEHYLRANDLVPHPFAIFNIATDYQRLGKLREAATWFERYLDATADAADRERINRLVLDLRDRPAAIKVTSKPDGARVFIDGIPSGTTPYVATIKGGAHRIVVDKDGQKEARDIKVEFAEAVALDVELRAPTGVLRVRGQPAGALISVDNVAAGNVPARLVLPPGDHVVRVTSAGYEPFETTATVVSGRDTDVDARLVRPGSGAPGTGGLGTPTSQGVKFGYLLGAVGGADARGSGGLALVEFGVRLQQYDAGARIGRQAGLIAVDLFVRWSLTPGRIAPFFGIAYSFIEGGGGYALGAGLRFDVVRAERASISLMAESGVRYFTGTVSKAGESPTSTSGLIVPVMASLLVVNK